jgi:hypothetical protein
VLLDDASQHSLVYKTARHTFTIANPVYHVYIADFDLSCIGGVIENYKVFEYQFLQPTYNFGSSADHRMDIFKFVAMLADMWNPRISRALYTRLQMVFNGTLEWSSAENFYCPNARVLSRNIPTPATLIFNTDLFDVFTAIASSSIIKYTVIYSSTIYPAAAVAAAVCRLSTSGEYRETPYLLSEARSSAEAYFASMDSNAVVEISKRSTINNLEKQLDMLIMDITYMVFREDSGVTLSCKFEIFHRTKHLVDCILNSERSRIPTSYIVATVVCAFCLASSKVVGLCDGYTYPLLASWRSLYLSCSFGIEGTESQLLQVMMQINWILNI